MSNLYATKNVKTTHKLLYNIFKMITEGDEKLTFIKTSTVGVEESDIKTAILKCIEKSIYLKEKLFFI